MNVSEILHRNQLSQCRLCRISVDDLSVTRVGYQSGDAYSAWLEEDSARTDSSREEIARLTRISQLRPMYKAQVSVMKGEEFQLGLDVKENDVFFVELIPL